ncbi:DUF692 family multinuclear iron-containing protein [Rhodococcus sp. 1168]|uniref:multinuclear nonheme iron-dependent oxidase n=1 Tax=Rhodococcus sp. 1168 TaxID=2018041 RepID=UPI00159351B5|nr:DUF692 family multinuclear iron-containing protein [Rhodococcus sp. 1168]
MSEPRNKAVRRGLGVGMDLPWGAPVGFDPDTPGPNARVRAFLDRHAADYAYLSFAFQPRGTVPLTVAHYREPYRALIDSLPAQMPVALHQTLLNLGSVQDYDRSMIYEFTNELNREFDWAWIVEDLGMWSLGGIPMPYPLPPYLVEDNVANVAGNIAEAVSHLHMPLRVEFPGFTDGVTVVVGDIDAYDFFRRVTDISDSEVTLDVGHLISWRWWSGRRGRELYGDLNRLPLDRCRELHLAGSAISRGRFLDLHHGVLMEEQLVLAEELLSRCPNLEAITYEDPNYGRTGELVPKSIERLERLRGMVSQWAAA